MCINLSLISTISEVEFEMPKDQETRVLIGGRKFRKIPVLASVSVENESSDSLGRRSRSFSKKSYDTDTDGGHSGLRRRMTTAVTAVDESYFTPPNKIGYQQQMGVIRYMQ